MIKFILVRILRLFQRFSDCNAYFFMTRMAPGGPFDSEKNIPDEIKEKLEAHFGLDKPLHEQFILYINNLLQGDLGPSFKYMGWDVSGTYRKGISPFLLNLVSFHMHCSTNGTPSRHHCSPS